MRSTPILLLKTGALGDVLRTTSILPGLHRRHPGARITWLTAPGAAPLVHHHPLVAEVVVVDPAREEDVVGVARELAGRGFEWVLSFDDEVALCRAASIVGAGRGRVSGAYLDGEGERRYTADVAPWFDMGLLSVHGKAEADRRKAANRESHPAIFARMLGIEPGEPELLLPEEALAAGARFAAREGVGRRGAVVGLNTGAGGRWESKRLPVERTAALACELDRRLGGRVESVLLGGLGEAERNAEILRAARELGGDGWPRIVDAGTENGLLEFAAIVDGLDLLVTSDSLALHVAVARRVPVVAFFAPTSAAEIELYGRGEKVASTAPDACSYRPDADTSTLTVERLSGAALETLERFPPGHREKGKRVPA